MNLKHLLLAITMVCSMTAAAITLPQFSATNYSGWDYNSSAVTLTTANINANRIVLYKSLNGKVLNLISPLFDCDGGEVVNMKINYVAEQWQDEGFVPQNTALTVALLDEQGTVMDSIIYTPQTLDKQNVLDINITIPQDLKRAQLRYTCWKASASNCCAIRKIVFAAVVHGDVNGDNEVSIADVNAIIDMILAGTYDVSGDVNSDGEVSIADVNAVVDIILNNEE